MKYKIVRKWNFYNAYPVKWKIADLTVESQKIAIEKLELTFDYFEMDQCKGRLDWQSKTWLLND
jgi:phage tail-like protein